MNYDTRQNLIETLNAMLIIGDLGKNFHRPECECESCELWRRRTGVPMRESIHRLLKELGHEPQR